jgi:hypothetical protein
LLNKLFVQKYKYSNDGGCTLIEEDKLNPLAQTVEVCQRMIKLLERYRFDSKNICNNSDVVIWLVNYYFILNHPSFLLMIS